MIAFIVRPVEQVSSKLLFSGLFQQRPRGVRVANRGGGLAAKRCGQGDRAHGAGAQGGELVDQQVRVSGVGPAAASVVQPLAGDVQCQRVQRPDPAVDHELAIADVKVVELEAPDRTGSRGVHRGEREDQPVHAAWRPRQRSC